MILNLKVDTDQIWQDEEGGVNFEDLFGKALKDEALKAIKDKINSDQFKVFSEKISETIIAETKIRMQNFLDEEIVLTERWGKTTFVGSIEDLIKMRFDEVLLRTVNDRGETLQGCSTTDHPTWIEWLIKAKLDLTVKQTIDSATKRLETTATKYIDKCVAEKITEIQNGLMKTKISEAFAAVLEKK